VELEDLDTSKREEEAEYTLENTSDNIEGE